MRLHETAWSTKGLARSDLVGNRDQSTSSLQGFKKEPSCQKAIALYLHYYTYSSCFGDLVEFVSDDEYEAIAPKAATEEVDSILLCQRNSIIAWLGRS